MFQHPITSAKEVQDLIEEIKAKIPDYHFSNENLIKFKS